MNRLGSAQSQKNRFNKTRLKKLISINGVKKINISTDIKLAYREGILTAIKNGTFDKQGFQAVSVENDINNAIAKVAEAKLRLLDGKC